MFIAKNKEQIILAKDTKAELLEALKFIVYDTIEETQEKYTLYNGKYLLANQVTQEERNRKDMLALTRCDVLKALYQAKGITPNDIKALLKDNVEALIELEYAQNFYRGHPIIKSIGEQLGFTSDDLDYLFENKKFKEEVTDENI